MKNMNNAIIILCLSITITLTSGQTLSQTVRWRGERYEIIEYTDWGGVRLVLTCKTNLAGCRSPELVTKEFLDARIKMQATTTQKPLLIDRFPIEANEQNFAPQELTQNSPASNLPQNVPQRVTTTRRPAATSKPLTISDRVANGILQLGINIFGLTSSTNNDDIQVISPVSIAEATSLIQLGAKGQTLLELMKLNGQSVESGLNSIQYHNLLGQLLQDASPEDYQKNVVPNQKHIISVTNAIFLKQGYSIRNEYRAALEAVYQSHHENLNFQGDSQTATRKINEWVKSATQGKIDSIVSSISPATQALIVSTLYFKALWDPNVGVQAVIKEKFYPNGIQGQPITVDMLLIEGDSYLYHKSDELDCRMIGLDYDKGLSTMFIILPNNSTKNKLIKLRNQLSAEHIENMIQNSVKKSASIIIPKFHVQQTSDIQNAMQNLGLNSLFNPSTSDLSLITSGLERNTISNRKSESDNRHQTPIQALEDLERLRHTELTNPHIYVDQIIHKVVLTVDEKGTEGGAATGAVVNKMGSSVLFLAQTPFMFLIRHNPTKLPLFYGAVIVPSFDKV